MLPQRLHKAFSELTRLLERLPNGMPWDEIQTKVNAIKNMRRKDHELFLAHCAESGRLEVIETTRKGEEASPVIRHRKFNEPLTAVEQPVPSISDNVVHTASPGKLTIAPQSAQHKVMTAGASAPAQQFETAAAYRNWITGVPMTETAAISALAVTVYRIEEGSDEPKDSEGLIKISGDIRFAATSIALYLRMHPYGVNRTTLNNKCMAYHDLVGAPRQRVIAELLAQGIIVEQQNDHDKRAAKVLVHRSFVKSLPASEKKFDHDAPQLTLDPIHPTVEPTQPDVLAFGGEKAITAESELSLTEMVDITERVYSFVKVAGRGGMAFARLHDLCSEYHNLTVEDRKRVIRYLVDSKQVNTYNRGTVPYIEIVPEVDNGRNETYTPVVKVPEITRTTYSYPTEPEDTMETKDQTAPIDQTLPEGSSAAAIRERAAQMLALAEQLERREQDQAMVEMVRPVYETIRGSYEDAQKALEQQIDALAEMGVAVERLGEILNQK